VPAGLLQRRLEFGLLSGIDMTVVFVSAGGAVLCARAGMGMWSLVVQGIVATVLQSALAWFASEYRVSSAFNVSMARAALSFGMALSMSSIAAVLAHQAYSFIIGRHLGAYSLGLYGRASGVSLLLNTTIGALAGSVMFPALAALPDKSSRKTATLKATGALVFALAPLAAGLTVAADLLVLLLYGPKWLPAAEPLRILSLAFFVNVSLYPVIALYNACGRSDLMLKITLFAAAVSTACAATGAAFGSLRSVAYGYLAYSLILAVPQARFAGALVGIRLADLLRVAIGPIGSAAVMGVAVVIARAVLPPLRPLLEFAATVAVGVITYAATAILLRLEVLVHIRGLLIRRPKPTPEPTPLHPS
jgi:PST family polysaccharide transporter